MFKTLAELNKKEPKQRMKVRFKMLNFDSSDLSPSIDKKKYHKKLRRNCKKLIEQELDNTED